VSTTPRQRSAFTNEFDSSFLERPASPDGLR
jgi:hypothetical protein